MKSALTTSIICCALIGALGAGMYAARNASSAAATSRSLIASMINPSDAISSPRTYNQTLVETINTTTLVANLQSQNLPVTGVTFDVLPDSYHIQATATLSDNTGSADTDAVATAITGAVSAASATLSSQLFTDNIPIPTTHVVLTKVLPSEPSIQQNPTAATGYGAVVGALFGWFLGLTLIDRKSSR